MKKTYSKPMVESESVFETLAAGCSQVDMVNDLGCMLGGVQYNS
jgi:hypothetical protein